MEEDYKLNKSLKRLEPIDKTCQFCNNGHSVNMNRNHYTPLFKENDRTNLIVYNSVKFQKIFIGISRCNACFVTHKKHSLYGTVINLLVAALITLISFSIWGGLGLFVGIPSFIIALFTAMHTAAIFTRRKGLRTKKEVSMKTPLIQEMVIAGWSFHQPTA